VLCFPGLFRGLLDAAATRVTDEMKIAAAHAIAAVVSADELAADHIIPSPFDRSVAPAVATAVAEEARREGHVRPGSRGSLEDEADAQAHEAARRAVERAVSRRLEEARAASPDRAPAPGSAAPPEEPTDDDPGVAGPRRLDQPTRRAPMDDPASTTTRGVPL
jgi:hypothetical protein